MTASFDFTAKPRPVAMVEMLKRQVQLAESTGDVVVWDWELKRAVTDLDAED